MYPPCLGGVDYILASLAELTILTAVGQIPGSGQTAYVRIVFCAITFMEVIMKPRLVMMIGGFCAVVWAAVAIKPAFALLDEQILLQVDRAAFGSGPSSIADHDKLLDPDLTWTDSSGNTRNKSEIMEDFRSGKGLPLEARHGSDGGKGAIGSEKAHVNGRVGLIQTNSGKLYILRIWVKRTADWRLLIYHAVSTGIPASGDPGKGDCENPCNTVPFRPESEDQAEVIRSYQAVERAVTAHDSAAWAAHIADEFFAVTSNSDRPLDKATRMAGLDNQKVAGIAPFPLVSARMFEFGSVMLMTSIQQPEHGLLLHVTRVWFKRNGAWLEGYSYQTTIQAASSAR